MDSNRATDRNVSAFQLLLHLGYLNAFFNYDWSVALYWTLAIEFQFYLSIGLLFPLISHRSLLIRSITMCCLAGLFLITPNKLLLLTMYFFFCWESLPINSELS